MREPAISVEARGTPETPAELEQHDCIMFEGIYSNNLWSFGRGMKAAVLPVRPRFAVNTADAAIEAALASAGITHVLSYQVAEAVVCDALRLILRPYEPELLPVHIVYADATEAPCISRLRRATAKGIHP